MELSDKTKIPNGLYCYDNSGVCPYWTIVPDRPQMENGYCAYLGAGDWQFGGLLWDQVKECGENDDA